MKIMIILGQRRIDTTTDTKEDLFLDIEMSMGLGREKEITGGLMIGETENMIDKASPTKDMDLLMIIKGRDSHLEGNILQIGMIDC